MRLAGSWGRFTQALLKGGRAGTAGPEYPGTPPEAARSRDTHTCGYERPLPVAPGPEGVIRTALDAVAGTPGVDARFEFACQPNIGFSGDEQALRTVVMTLTRHAAEAGADRVLVTCAHKAGRLSLGVAATGVSHDPGTYQGPLRAVSELLALQGGGLEIAGRPGQGVILSAYWPDWAGARSNQTETKSSNDKADQPDITATAVDHRSRHWVDSGPA